MKAPRFEKLKGESITDAALPADWTLALEGEHNRVNAAYALAAARCLGIEDGITRTVLERFNSLPNRLQYVGEKTGSHSIMIANATTPDATIAALRTLGAKKQADHLDCRRQRQRAFL